MKIEINGYHIFLVVESRLSNQKIDQIIGNEIDLDQESIKKATNHSTYKKAVEECFLSNTQRALSFLKSCGPISKDQIQVFGDKMKIDYSDAKSIIRKFYRNIRNSESIAEIACKEVFGIKYTNDQLRQARKIVKSIDCTETYNRINQTIKLLKGINK